MKKPNRKRNAKNRKKSQNTKGTFEPFSSSIVNLHANQTLNNRKSNAN